MCMCVYSIIILSKDNKILLPFSEDWFLYLFIRFFFFLVNETYMPFFVIIFCHSSMVYVKYFVYRVILVYLFIHLCAILLYLR